MKYIIFVCTYNWYFTYIELKYYDFDNFICEIYEYIYIYENISLH